MRHQHHGNRDALAQRRQPAVQRPARRCIDGGEKSSSSTSTLGWPASARPSVISADGKRYVFNSSQVRKQGVVPKHQTDAALLRRLPQAARAVEPAILRLRADTDAARQTRDFRKPAMARCTVVLPLPKGQQRLDQRADAPCPSCQPARQADAQRQQQDRRLDGKSQENTGDIPIYARTMQSAP